MKFLCANMAGGSRNVKVGQLANGYLDLINQCQPDIILFQEAAREITACHWAGAVMRNLAPPCVGGRRDLLGQLATEFAEYRFFFAPAIQSNRDSHPEKWARMGVRRTNTRGQGCAIAIHEDAKLLDFWTGKETFIEPIELLLPISIDNCIQSIFTGDRNSEHRIAQGIRIRLETSDLTLWNVHLTTIRGEREGNSDLDKLAKRFALTN